MNISKCKNKKYLDGPLFYKNKNKIFVGFLVLVGAQYDKFSGNETL